MEMNNVPKMYTKKYLPSKNILILIGIIIFGLLVYILGPKLYNYYQENRSTFSFTGKPPEPLILNTTASNDLDKDSDGDGIPDWKETLFGLNPKKLDSDGDGIPDVLPMINGTSAGDLIQIPEIGKFTLSIYETLIDGQATNSPATQEQLENVTSEKMLAYAENYEKGLKKYTTIDITLIDTTQTSIRSYAQEITQIGTSAPDLEQFTKNTQDALLRVASPAPTELSFLQSTISKLLKMQVPTQAADLHLSLLNSAYLLLQILETPKEQRTDELMVYTLSILTQKNINLAAKTIYEIQALGKIYETFN